MMSLESLAIVWRESETEKVEKYWKLMEPNELLSGMFISGVTADAAFYGDCAR